DGLETLSEDEIAQVLREGAGDGPGGLADRLIAAVEARGRRGQDNTTVIVVAPFGGAARAETADTPTIIPERARRARPGRRGVGVMAGIVAVLIVAGAAVAWTLGLPPFGRDEPMPPASETRDGGAVGGGAAPPS